MNEYVNILAKKALRITSHRLEILNWIMQNKTPFSVSEVYSSLGSDRPIDLATVYRTVNKFLEVGILKEIATVDNEQYYAYFDSHKAEHPHFYCQCCHKISCLASLTNKDVMRISSFAPNSKIEKLSVTLSGVCDNCEKKRGDGNEK